MQNVLNLDKSKKYLLGVSGGSDSMMLLSLCLKAGLNVIVAHCNYKLRANADKEEALLKEYCQKNNVVIEVLYPKQDVKDNFQKWARDARYQFYKELYDKYNCDYLLLGHQKDDHIENYLMAIQRNSHGWGYGIKESTVIKNMNVLRPLLSYRKSETRDYCLSNNVPFGDDESNFSDKYTRNRIRHNLIEKADEKQIEIWMNEIELKNQALEKTLEEISSKYSDLNNIDLKQFNEEKTEFKKIMLRYLIYIVDPALIPSGGLVDELLRKIQTKNGNYHQLLSEDVIIVVEYETLKVTKLPRGFNYVLNNLEYKSFDEFTLTNEGKVIEGVTLTTDDFPITIRNPKENDSINLRFGHKKINRFFVDNKIPYLDRLTWLIIENQQKEIVFVSGIGCEVNHYSIKPNVFVVK